MDIQQNKLLTEYNTFHIAATAQWFISYHSLEDLQTLVRDEYFQECRILSIGEGSNLLFLANFHGIILHSEIKNIEEIARTSEKVVLRVGSGMKWDDFVAYAVEHEYYGIENLSLIPGQVGSSAIQNIGAYGAEVCQTIRCVHAIHRRTGELRVFERQECNYSYRHSIFKESEYADYIIWAVDFELSLIPTFNFTYRDLAECFGSRAEKLSLAEVRRTVIDIRNAKLPDTNVMGNAGSFFMNPIVNRDTFEVLQRQFPDIPHYPLRDGREKVPAGWLIDRCGLKGYRTEHAGVYEEQALVLVNLGGATGTDIAQLAEYVQEQVRTRFGIDIYPEVRYIS